MLFVTRSQARLENDEKIDPSEEEVRRVVSPDTVEQKDEEEHHESAVDLYHARIGHFSVATLSHTRQRYPELCKWSKRAQRSFEHYHAQNRCRACVQSKQQSAAVRREEREHVPPPLEARGSMSVWHADLSGPYSSLIRNRSESQGGTRRYKQVGHEGQMYSLFIVDEFSRFIWVLQCTSKAEVAEKFIAHVTRIQHMRGTPLMRLHTDAGTELVNAEVRVFLDKNKTLHTTAPRATPELNGIAERSIGVINTLARSMLLHCQGSQELWPYAQQQAVLIHNLVVTARRYDRLRTPKEGEQRVEKKIPCAYDQFWDNTTYTAESYLQKLRVFGSDAYLLKMDSALATFQERGENAVYLGFDVDRHQHRLLRRTRVDGPLTVDYQRDVTVVENEFTLLPLWKDEIMQTAQASYTSSAVDQDPLREWAVDRIVDDRVDDDGVHRYKVYWQNYMEPSWEPAEHLTNAADALALYHQKDSSVVISSLLLWETEVIDDSLVKGMDILVLSATESVSLHLDYVEPRSYRQANDPRELFHTQWVEAFASEYASLQAAGVFELIFELPTLGQTVLATQWVLKVKRDKDNCIVRWKARLVVRGDHQVEGIDFTDTFSPTIARSSLKYILALAARYDWEIKQIDFDTAFLNAPLEEDVYIKLPDGYDAPAGVVCLRLRRALYGLKQAPRAWFLTIDAHLKSIGYRNTALDQGLYVKIVRLSGADHRIFLTLYVDDTLAIFPACLSHIWENDKEAIRRVYAIKDMGDCEWILNIKLERDRANYTLTLSQEAYFVRMLSEHVGKEGLIRSVSSPFQYDDLSRPGSHMPEGALRDELAQPLSSDEKLKYQSIVGELLYAAGVTRVDIQYIAGALGRYTAAPTRAHLIAAKRVVRYIGSTTKRALIFDYSDPVSRQGELAVTIYTDSNWASESTDRKSTGGWLALLSGAFVTWQSKKQSTIALSSTEAEYYALGEAVREALLLRQWLKLYVLPENISAPQVLILCDNISAGHIADHPTSYQRTKHIDIRHHFVRAHVEDLSILIKYVETKRQLADILTKSFDIPRFQQLKKQLDNGDYQTVTGPVTRARSQKREESTQDDKEEEASSGGKA